MAAVQHLCDRGLLLENGRVVHDGPGREVMANYLRRQSSAAGTSLQHFENRTGTRQVVFTSFHVEDAGGNRVNAVLSGENISFVFGYHCPSGPVRGRVNVGYGLHAPTGERLTILYASHTGDEFDEIPISGEFRCEVSRFPFNPGRYCMFPRIEVNGIEADFPRDGVGEFDVEAGDFYSTGRQTTDRSHAPFLICGRWHEVGCVSEVSHCEV
jgi:lipopolysaccharide transport system ATP-binding protein